MKIKMSTSRLTLLFLGCYLFLGVSLFFIMFGIFVLQSWNALQPIIIALYLISGIVFYLLAIKNCYFVANKGDFEVHKFSKVTVFSYKDILFLDEEQYFKKGRIALFTYRKDTFYFPKDKDQTLFNLIKKNGKNLLTKEEFSLRFPNVKL